MYLSHMHPVHWHCVPYPPCTMHLCTGHHAPYTPCTVYPVHHAPYVPCTLYTMHYALCTLFTIDPMYCNPAPIWILKDDYLLPSPIPNSKFHPITVLKIRPTYLKSDKNSPPPCPQILCTIHPAFIWLHLLIPSHSKI